MLQERTTHDAIIDGLVEEIRTRYYPTVEVRNRTTGSMFSNRPYYCIRIPWDDAQAQSPQIPNWATTNPCYEIPQDYELYVYFEDGTMFIMNKDWPMDIADPNFVGDFVGLFSDLRGLTAALRDHQARRNATYGNPNR